MSKSAPRGMREGQANLYSQCVCVCACAYTFTALKPNKHCPSASQGERTAVSFRSSSPMAVQETVSHQRSVHVSMTQTLGWDCETSVQPQFTALFIVPVAELCLTKTAYSDRVNRLWNLYHSIRNQLLLCLLCTLKLHFYRRDLKAKHFPCGRPGAVKTSEPSTSLPLSPLPPPSTVEVEFARRLIDTIPACGYRDRS